MLPDGYVSRTNDFRRISIKKLNVEQCPYQTPFRIGNLLDLFKRHHFARRWKNRHSIPSLYFPGSDRLQSFASKIRKHFTRGASLPCRQFFGGLQHILRDVESGSHASDATASAPIMVNKDKKAGPERRACLTLFFLPRLGARPTTLKLRRTRSDAPHLRSCCLQLKTTSKLAP